MSERKYKTRIERFVAEEKSAHIAYLHAFQIGRPLEEIDAAFDAWSEAGRRVRDRNSHFEPTGERE